MYKNRVGGGAERGERASRREAAMTRLRRRKFGGRAVKDSVLTWGDLASLEGQRYIQAGRTWAVDGDLEQFFDRVNHDVLRGRLAKRIGDGRVLGLIRRDLEAGILANGVTMERHEGTPQGGPLSPLLANVLLDEVYVQSRRAGERVMGLLRRLYERLRLRVNESIDRAWNRKILGYSFSVAPGRR